MRLCSVCERKHYCRGWCSLHYQRWRAYGDPLAEVRPPEGYQIRLRWLRDALQTRDRDEGCWQWPFSTFPSTGYGRVPWEGKSCSAAVVSLILDGRPKPPAPRDHALHSCDNPPCVNPAHLRWGTPKENMNDRVQRGRGFRMPGEANHRAKLTDSDVKRIRSSAKSVRDLAAEYGVKEDTIREARTRRSWRHLA